MKNIFMFFIFVTILSSCASSRGPVIPLSTSFEDVYNRNGYLDKHGRHKLKRFTREVLKEQTAANILYIDVQSHDHLRKSSSIKSPNVHKGEHEAIITLKDLQAVLRNQNSKELRGAYLDKLHNLDGSILFYNNLPNGRADTMFRGMVRKLIDPNSSSPFKNCSVIGLDDESGYHNTGYQVHKNASQGFYLCNLFGKWKSVRLAYYKDEGTRGVIEIGDHLWNERHISFNQGSESSHLLPSHDSPKFYDSLLLLLKPSDYILSYAYLDESKRRLVLTSTSRDFKRNRYLDLDMLTLFLAEHDAEYKEYKKTLFTKKGTHVGQWPWDPVQSPF